MGPTARISIGILVLALGLSLTAYGDKKAAPTFSYPSHVGRVTFGHKAHIDDHGLECDSCHHQVRAKSYKTPHDRYFASARVNCAHCHGQKAATNDKQKCSQCHRATPQLRPWWDQHLSGKLAFHQKCWECHERGEGAAAAKACVFCHKGEKKAW